MPRVCSVCRHADLAAITRALMQRASYREIQKRYAVSKSALDRHVRGHVTASFRALAAAEAARPDLAAAEVRTRTVREQMDGLHAKTLQVLARAERSKDISTILAAVRECRHNLELCARLRGELAPHAAGETSGPLQVTIQYVERQLNVAGDSAPQLAAAPEGGIV